MPPESKTRLSRPALAFVDLETTGANPETDRITEIGIVRVDADGVTEWSSLVNPGTPISAFIEKLTGISDELVADAPDFGEVSEMVRKQLRGCIFVAHNARFDYGFLRNEFRRIGSRFSSPVACTVKLSRKLFPQHHRHNLDSLIERHVLSAGGERHRALTDARLIHRFFEVICRDLGEAEVLNAISVQTALPPMPPHLPPSSIDGIPSGPGALIFYGEGRLPLFVAAADNLRAKLFSLIAAAQRRGQEARLIPLIHDLEWQETLGRFGARLLEIRLQRELRPSFNKAPRIPPNDNVLERKLVWPHRGVLAIKESDAFSGRETAHLFHSWRYLGSARSEVEIAEAIACRVDTLEFIPEVYDLLRKCLAKPNTGVVIQVLAK